MKAATSPDSRQPQNKTCTTTIPHVAAENAVDTRFSTFLAEEFSALERKLEEEASLFANGLLQYNEGEPLEKAEWRKLVEDKNDSRTYMAYRYTNSEGKPRRVVMTQPYPSGETALFHDLTVTKSEYQTWAAARKAEAGRLTDAERERLEAERSTRRAKEAAERAERAERERVRAEQQCLEAAKEAARKAETLEATIAAWPHLPVATTHPYLKRKGLEGRTWHDVRRDGRNLALAVRNVLTDEIVGIQYISSNGSKWFAEGTPKKNACIWLTDTPSANAKRFIEAEGWGTAASCTLAVEGQKSEAYVVASIDAGNLASVYHALKARWPNANIVIASDNDAGTALKTDKNGKQLENVGQVKAHTLALEVGCKVAVPHLPGKTGTNVDFSDVYAELGPVEVERQLAAAGYAKAEFAENDLDDKSFLRGYKLAQTYRCSITVSTPPKVGPPELELPELRPGVTVLRALMGTGKTKAVARWLEAHPQFSALAISHLRGLTADLAERLNLEDYRNIPTGYEHSSAHSAYCVNSLWRLALRGAVKPVDVVFADEIAQLLRRLTSRRDFARKRQCLAVLEYLVRSAKYVVVADAHVDTTVMQWLQRLRPDDAPHMVLSTHRPGTGRKVYRHARKGDVRAVARDKLISGKHVYYALNGLERAHEINGWIGGLKTDLPNLKVLLVCSDTAAEETVKAFFRDPNGESAKYDLIIASPSVSTGVSISNGHFDVVCGEFVSRVGTPNDALQSLSRVRGCPELHVWVEKRRANHVTDRDAIRSAFWTDAGDDDNLADIDPKTGQMTVSQGYAELYVDVKVAEHKTVNFYTVDFWRFVEEDGYTVKDGEAADDAEEIETHARDAAKEAAVQAVLKAATLTDEAAATLRRSQGTRTLTRAERDDLERYDLTQFYRLDPDTTDDELRAVVERDRRGNLRREINRLELVATSADEIAAKMREQRERDTLAPDVTRYDHRHKAWRVTLSAAKLNPETLQATGESYDADELRETWIKPLEAQWQTYRVSVGSSWPELKYAQSQPLKALGGVLRGAFGLTHRRAGKNAIGTYTVSTAPLEARKALIDKRCDEKGTDNLLYKGKHIVASVPAPSVPTQITTTSNTVQDADPAEREVFSNYTGEYEHLWQTLTTGPLQDDGYFNGLRESCEQAAQGNLPAQWHVDVALKQPEVQRRLGLA